MSNIEKINIEEIVGFDYSYKGDANKVRVAEILGLEDTSSWEIIDQCGNLALVHYKENHFLGGRNKQTQTVDMEKYGHLRGVLVDVERGAVIASSFGYTPTVVSDRIEVIDDTITLIDTQKTIHKYDPEKTIIKRVFEGVVMRVIWYEGKSYRLTHRKINPSKSRWGNSPLFLDMYKEAGGPTDEELFDTTKPFSDSCYVFLVCHPNLLVGTRQLVNKPYIVCLAHYKMDIKQDASLIASGIDIFKRSSEISSEVNESFVHYPSNLTLEEANKHLTDGYYDRVNVEDERQKAGEAIILYEMKDGRPEKIIKVHSPSYDWRIQMRGNDSNIKHRFYCLLDLVYNCQNTTSAQLLKALSSRLVLVPAYEKAQLLEYLEANKGIIYIPDNDDLEEFDARDFEKRESKIHLLWINYVLSLPLNLQRDALELYESLMTDKRDITKKLIDIHMGKYNFKNKAGEIMDPMLNDKFPLRANTLISDCRRFAKTQPQNQRQRQNQNQQMNAFEKNINNFINKERGDSLYSLIKKVGDFLKLWEKIKQEASA